MCCVVMFSGRNTGFVSAPWRILGCDWCFLESCWGRGLVVYNSFICICHTMQSPRCIAVMFNIQVLTLPVTFLSTKHTFRQSLIISDSNFQHLLNSKLFLVVSKLAFRAGFSFFQLTYQLANCQLALTRRLSLDTLLRNWMVNRSRFVRTAVIGWWRSRG